MENINDFLDFDVKKAKDRIKKFIRSNIIESNRDGAIIGLSGGLDSCLVLKLCVEAIGSSNVKAVIIPERDSDPLHIRDAKNFAVSLSVPYIVKNISPILWWLGVYRLYPPSFFFSRRLQAQFVKNSQKKISQEVGDDIFLANLKNKKNTALNKGKAFYRIKHRLRSSILFYYSDLFNMLLVGTSNKSEILTGFFVKYGDNIADIMPLSFLYKTQVKILSNDLRISRNLIEKAPSPDLIPGVLDEDMLGISYERLDRILYGIECNHDDNKISDTSGASQHEIERVRTLMHESEHLRLWPISLT